MTDENKLLHLSKLISDLTTSGKNSLDENKFKQVKKFCKESDLYVKEVYSQTLKMLKKKHAEIRFSAFQIVQELFKRSSVFRAAVTKDFKDICEYILGINKYRPLPQPLSVSKKLKQLAVETIQKWNDEFGEEYPALKLAYNYLKQYHKIDFEELTARSELERIRDEQQRIKAEDIKQRKIVKVTDEISNDYRDIENTVSQFENTFNLLVPNLNDFFISLPDDDTGNASLTNDTEIDDKPTTSSVGNNDSLYGSDFMRSHGLIKGTNVNIDLNNIRKVYENDDNEVIIGLLKEQTHVISKKLLPRIKEWEQKILPYSSDCEDLLKKVIKLKSIIEKAINTYTSIIIVPKRKNSKENDLSSSDDDDDFIEVPINDTNTTADESELLGISSDKNKVIQDFSIPGSSGYIPKKNNNKPKTKYLCPDSYLSAVDFKRPSKCINTMAGLSQVWNANEVLHENNDDDESSGKSTGIMGIDTTAVNFEREFVPVKWECRAPLKSGQLCPRKDRERCPFHGAIVARDEVGIPVSPEDRKRDEERRHELERLYPDWQDPQLLSEIKAATGVDLDIKKAKKRKRRYPNLTDVKAAYRTPKARLKRKIFNKKAIKRVNQALSKSES